MSGSGEQRSLLLFCDIHVLGSGVLVFFFLFYRGGGVMVIKLIFFISNKKVNLSNNGHLEGKLGAS